MQWVDRNKQTKYLLIIVAIVIATISLVFSHYLVRDLEKDARSKMTVWAEAMRSLNNADEDTDISLILKVINNNDAIPVIVLNMKGDVMDYRNIKLVSGEDTVAQLKHKVKEMRHSGYSIKMSYDDQEQNENEGYMEILYDESLLLKRLSVYPFVQIGVVGVFFIIMVYALLNSKRAEQNRVWVGLTKETAHQLGTPISSLMAWIEIMKENDPDNIMVDEMSKDVDRLNLIAERFSKIGSVPELKVGNLCEVIDHVVSYIRRRTSDDVVMECRFPEDRRAMLPLCAPLLEWVVEVLCKNAIDAMAGSGSITITVFRSSWQWVVDVKDTGKGIPNKHLKTVFKPGFTTKQRGWGLGLSLAKRIVEEYHGGRIYVKASEMGVGTTFRIELKA